MQNFLNYGPNLSEVTMRSIVLYILSFFISFSLCFELHAQTTLSAGDIAIVRMNEDSPSDGFSFLTLVQISAGTIIYFTEEGWGNSAWCGTAESHLKYTAPGGGLTAGTVVHIDETTTADVFSITGGGGSIAFAWSTAGFNLSAGDQILVYQTNEASKPESPTFIAGLTLNDGNSAGEPNDPLTGWTSASAPTVSGVATSRLPPGLTNGTNCISVFPDYTVLTEKDNARFNCTLTSGTRSQLLAAINNKNNWIYDDGANYPTSSVCSFMVSTAAITFTNGSGFNQTITPGSSNQALGRFQLTGNISGSSLASATIRLNGARTGLSNLKLWLSSDASFGGDTQVGSTVAADPGDGNSVSFSSFSSPINTSGTYFFLTADVAAGASGTVQGVVAQNSSFTISDGSILGIITNAILSNNTTPLPVQLTSFTATAVNDEVLLCWQTATETMNYGFMIERVIQSSSNWETVGFVKGHGNSNSPRDYAYSDKPSGGNNFKYRLKQIDNDGNYEYTKEIEVTLTPPTEFWVKQNFPNPFNPSTSIEFSIPSDNNVQVKVFNILGMEITTLLNGHRKAGTHRIVFNAGDLADGVYFYKIISGKYSELKKMILLK